MIKIIGIGGLALAFLIPLLMVADLISERETTRDQAVRAIGDAWAHQQQITGPFLCVPFRPAPTFRKGKPVQKDIQHAIFLPEELKVTGNISEEARRKGIFETIVYRTHLQLSGYFANAGSDRIYAAVEEFYWKKAVITMGISDNRGIEGQPQLEWNQKKLVFRPAPAAVEVVERGIHVPVPLRGAMERSAFSVDVVLRGTRQLLFAPTASLTTVTLSSKWPAPSFVGAFLPAESKVSTEGFRASWSVSHLARSYPQAWTTCSPELSALRTSLNDSYFGVELFQPVDLYRNLTRSVKYGVLFVGVTFLCFFLFETLVKLRIHPIQYTAVGAALCIFYLLLLSLAEHLDFGKAFLIAGIANVLLISGYGKAFLGASGRVALLASLLSGLYLFLYVLLQIEDYALLVGSVAVFLALALFMFLTRRLNWYELA